jgi:hypothetical protein
MPTMIAMDDVKLLVKKDVRVGVQTVLVMTTSAIRGWRHSLISHAIRKGNITAPPPLPAADSVFLDTMLMVSYRFGI